MLRRSPTLDPVYDSTCFEHVCFEGKDYLGRMIYIRLGSWTRYPSEGIFPDGTADPQYWTRDPVTVLAIMSSYGRPCGYRVRNTIDRLDLSYPLQLSVRTRELIDTLNLAIFTRCRHRGSETFNGHWRCHRKCDRPSVGGPTRLEMILSLSHFLSLLSGCRVRPLVENI